jgi:cellulose synthase/poly-beta-1,6-N-acetylglucosamine synthase-like glycosyltransferase
MMLILPASETFPAADADAMMSHGDSAHRPVSAGANGAAAVAPPPRVSIVVPAVHADDEFRACLASLSRLDPPYADLVVAVDGGNEAAAALARAHGARVVVLRERGGPARARNAAARVAAGDILFFVDADVTVQPDAVARVRSALSDHPGDAAIVGSYDDAPAATNFLSQCKNLAHRFVHQTARDEACAFWSACGAVRREAFVRAGGYDERYARSSIEDIELGARLIECGARIRMVKSLSVTHLKRWTPGRLLRSEIFDRAVPWTRLILASGRMPDDLNLRWSGRVAVAVACALAASLFASAWFWWARPAAVLFAALEVLIDARLARFFWRERGPMFAARALAWQWVHYLCCAAGLGLGVAMHLLRVDRRPLMTSADERTGPLAGGPECG